MPDALTLLKTRKSISAAFLGEPGPSESQLAEMLAIAARVPDHGKLAPWRFIVIAGEARRQAGALIGALFHAKHPDAPAAKVEEEQGKLAQAPLVVAVVSTAAPHVKIPEWEQVLSAGNAAFALVMAAHALGFAANWKTGFIAYDADARRVLGLTDAERVVALVHVGTPTVPPTERPRPDLAAIVTRWTPPPPA
jgi:nitroreductase